MKRANSFDEISQLSVFSMCRHIWQKVSAHLMKSVGTFDAKGETFIMFREKPLSTFWRNLIGRVK